jgi:pyrophosphatase PpaX
MKIRVALIDMDGTLWNGPLDWPQIRREIGLPQDGRPILHHLQGMSEEERARGLRILNRHEVNGVKNGELIPGAHNLLRYIKGVGIKCALVTNNSRANVDEILTQHRLSFDLVLTRDDGAFKPNPEAFLKALERLNGRPEEAVVIGDSHLDLLAAHRAGIETVILVHTEAWMQPLLPQDVSFKRASGLSEVKTILTRLLD